MTQYAKKGRQMQLHPALTRAAFGLAPLTLLLSACGAAPPPAPPPAGVSVAPVATRTLRSWDDFTARLQPIQSVDVRPRVSGAIDSANFPEGAHVHKGELLVQIDPRPYEAEVKRLAAQLLAARAQARLARSDADRAKRLLGENAIATNEFERLDATAQTAEANVTAASAALDTAKLNLSFTRVASPIDGRVSKALITRGNLVDSSSLLTTVVSDGPIYATFYADEHAYLRYVASQRGAGSPVFMGLMTEKGFPHRGALRFLDNTVDPKSGTIGARAVFDDAGGLLTPGLFARVRVVSSTASPQALVPEEALGTDLGKRFVLVLDQTNHVQYRAVTLGPAVADLRVITDGLKPGELIVVEGLNKVKPGDPVTPKRTELTISTEAEAALGPASDGSAGAPSQGRAK
ncbi:efflux RND transporter periplasmic adaptor subunit [Caulobacter sp. S45]|uniref:efflux RND transporter periplasmic adaptor subunit n=1 Tax=Caulobacter sp. S45 TaxID=1641861 RepID=UPI00131E9D2D|nr:efflux RND transporter periplasmic adaptor subunit [Caulobacter sp. S45]